MSSISTFYFFPTAITNCMYIYSTRYEILSFSIYILFNLKVGETETMSYVGKNFGPDASKAQSYCRYFWCNINLQFPFYNVFMCISDNHFNLNLLLFHENNDERWSMVKAHVFIYVLISGCMIINIMKCLYFRYYVGVVDRKRGKMKVFDSEIIQMVPKQPGRYLSSISI